MYLNKLNAKDKKKVFEKSVFQSFCSEARRPSTINPITDPALCRSVGAYLKEKKTFNEKLVGVMALSVSNFFSLFLTFHLLLLPFLLSLSQSACLDMASWANTAHQSTWLHINCKRLYAHCQSYVSLLNASSWGQIKDLSSFDKDLPVLLPPADLLPAANCEILCLRLPSSEPPAHQWSSWFLYHFQFPSQ